MNALLIPVMLAVPALCVAWLLPGLDPLGRATVGVASSLSLFLLVAQTMLVLKMWSPPGGAAVVGVICLALAGFGLRQRARRPAVAAEAAKPEQEDEEWLFEG